MRFVLFRNRFTGGFDQVAAFSVVEFVINVDNCSFFHAQASKGMIRRPAPLHNCIGGRHSSSRVRNGTLVLGLVSFCMPETVTKAMPPIIAHQPTHTA